MLLEIKDVCVSRPGLLSGSFQSKCGDKMCAWKEKVAYKKFKQNAESFQKNSSTSAVCGSRA